MNLFANRPEAAPVNTTLSTARFNTPSPARPDTLLTMTGDRLSVASERTLVKVAKQDALVYQAKAGDTFWGLARRFAATTSADGNPTLTEINAYAKDLQAANGGKATIRVGQSLKLPTTENATWKLPALVAAQKQLGKQASDFDWAQADAKWGYAETIDVRVPSLKGKAAQDFAVREYGPTKGGSLYQVEALKAPEAPREIMLNAQESLTLTAKPGETYWGIARRFAATMSPDGSPSATEINAYVKDLQTANGKFLKAGQKVTLPRTENATWKLEALAAAQKDVEMRQQAGEKLPAFDWAKAEVAWGYAEAMEVTVSPMLGGTPERLAVHATGRDTYSVQSLADYYRLNGLAE